MMQFQRSMTVLQVRDVEASEAFYARLGFQSHGAWSHDGVAVFAIVQRGAVTVGLQRLNGQLHVNTHWAVYVYVSDVTALHAEFVRQDLPELTEIRRDNPYGCDDFDVVDPDGHRLAFGQDLVPTHGPGLGENKEL